MIRIQILLTDAQARHIKRTAAERQDDVVLFLKQDIGSDV